MTTVRVFAYIFGALWTLAALLFLVFGVVMLVGGAGIASSSSSAGELGGLLNGFGAMFGAFGVLVLGLGVVGALVTWFCFWVGGALGRGSSVARVLFTVACGLYVALGLLSVVMSIATAQVDGGASLIVNLLLTALPVLLIALLWGPESARRHFAPAFPVAPPWGSTPVAIPGAVPMSQPISLPMSQPISQPMSQPFAPPVARLPASAPAWPLDASTDRLRPERAPTPRCRRCGTETQRHWVHCGHCGDRLPAVGV